MRTLHDECVDARGETSLHIFWECVYVCYGGKCKYISNGPSNDRCAARPPISGECWNVILLHELVHKDAQLDSPGFHKVIPLCNCTVVNDIQLCI